jgi:hypothetical protein
MPTGWRPADVVQKYPVYKIEDVYDFEKYNPKNSSSLTVWCWIQISLMLLFISYLFGNIAGINALSSSYIYVYSAFVFISIYANSELMDRNSYAFLWEIMRAIFGISIIYHQGDWFGLSQFFTPGNYFLISYFIISAIASAWFTYKHYHEDKYETLLRKII